ncbi:MAG: toll/interleukin-1 receptor domain-containing protein [Bacteroidales bacterium]|nr:toll/interleukin-1 receptor domain-containing protein [Bacteroidales bacterium]
MEQEFKYFSFISYNSKDTEWGKRVQRKLEHYRMPATLCSEHGWDRVPIKPVFFAPTDIQPGGLSSELQERLRASRNLIVICSPNSAKSEWVGKEIEFFHKLGRTNNIHFFIVDGVPHSGNPDTECFNPVVDTLGLPEILGANIHEKIYRWPWLNKERAYVQLITKLLGVEFDALWKRHRRLLIRKAIAWTIGIIAVIAALIGVWVTNQPFNTQVTLKDTVNNEQLPPIQDLDDDVVVAITLDNDVVADTLKSLDKELVFPNIPHRFLGKEVKVSVSSMSKYVKASEESENGIKVFEDYDTTITLGKTMTLNLKRNAAYYGNVRFTLWNVAAEKPVPNVTVNVEGFEATSDANGQVSIDIPFDQQRPRYNVTATSPAISGTIEMPCGEDEIIMVN